MTLTQVQKDQWLAALRSGIPQIRGRLRAPAYGAPSGTLEGRCCLGVLDDLTGGDQTVAGQERKDYENVVTLLGCTLKNDCVIKNDQQRDTFPQIADWLETRVVVEATTEGINV